MFCGPIRIDEDKFFCGFQLALQPSIFLAVQQLMRSDLVSIRKI